MFLLLRPAPYFFPFPLIPACVNRGLGPHLKPRPFQVGTRPLSAKDSAGIGSGVWSTMKVGKCLEYPVR